MVRFIALLLLLPTLAFGSVEIKGNGSTNVARVSTTGALLTNEVASDRPTYNASISGATTSAAWNLTCEGSAAVGLKLTQYCVTVSTGATAAAILTIKLVRTTAASTGGTALTNDGTGTTAVTRASPTASVFPGICRGLAATVTAGPVLDQFMVTVTAAATASAQTFCRSFGSNGDQVPASAVGVANGLAVTVSTAGAGSLAVGAATMVVIAE